MTQTTDIAAVVEALAVGDRFLVTSHENPDGDALGSLLAMHLALSSSARTASWRSSGRRRSPAEYAIPRPRRPRAPARPARRRGRSGFSSRSTVRRRRRLTDDRLLERGDRRQHRPPPRQHALRNREPRRRRGVVDGRGARRCLRRARRRADARDRRGALRGARDRHRTVPVREHDSEGAAARGASCSRRAPTSSGSSRASTSRCSSRR